MCFPASSGASWHNICSLPCYQQLVMWLLGKLSRCATQVTDQAPQYWSTFLSSSLDYDNSKWQSSQRPAEHTAHLRKVNTDGAYLVSTLGMRDGFYRMSWKKARPVVSATLSFTVDGRGPARDPSNMLSLPLQPWTQVPAGSESD